MVYSIKSSRIPLYNILLWGNIQVIGRDVVFWNGLNQTVEWGCLGIDSLVFPPPTQVLMVQHTHVFTLFKNVIQSG